MYVGAEIWALLRHLMARLGTINNECLRRILGATRAPSGAITVSSTELYRRTGTWSLVAHLDHLRLRGLGHIARLPNASLVKQLLFADGLVVGGMGPSDAAGGGGAGRADVQWSGMAATTLVARSQLPGWFSMAQDRGAWSALCTAVCSSPS